MIFWAPPGPPLSECSFTGLNRFSAVIDQYDTPKYRQHCRDLSVMVLDQLQQYPSYNYKLLVIGLDGSPSCGMNITGTSKEWRGHPTNIKTEGYPVQPGSGVVIIDGATGTELEKRGADMNDDAWCCPAVYGNEFIKPID